MASLVHRRGLLDNPVLVEEVVAAAGLALEHERLHARAARPGARTASVTRPHRRGWRQPAPLSSATSTTGPSSASSGCCSCARYAQSLLGCGGAAARRCHGRAPRLSELRQLLDRGAPPGRPRDPPRRADRRGPGSGDRVARRRRSTRVSIGPIPDERFQPRIEQVLPTALVAEAVAVGRAGVCACPWSTARSSVDVEGGAVAGRPRRRRGPGGRGLRGGHDRAHDPTAPSR